MIAAGPAARQPPGGGSPSAGEPPPIRRRRSSSHRVDSLLEISGRLPDRDRVLAALLDDHEVLTTEQVTRMLFRSSATCLDRLRALRTLGFVDRFLRARPASRSAVHWVPGPLSARLVALARGQYPPTAKALRERQDRLVASPRLDHLVGVNEFFADLIADARAHPGRRLARWWSEWRTAAAFQQRVHPDGHGVWAGERDGGDAVVGFFLEHDTGTESLPRVVAKLHAYRQLYQEGGPAYPVLFWLPSAAREDHLQDRLRERPPGVAVATAVRSPRLGPADAVWWLADGTERRLRLDQLPRDRGAPGPYHPGPAEPDEDPLSPLGVDR